MYIDDLLTTLRAAAFTKGVPAMAKEASVSDDTLRRILSDNPPGWLKTLRRLEEIVAKS